MGRIEEALRRATSPDGDQASANSAPPKGDDPFHSAWLVPESAANLQSVSPPTAGRETAAGGFRGFVDDWADLLTLSPTTNTRFAKQFSRLAGTLHNAQIVNGIKLVMTTSVGAGEGKTVTAMNLALVLSGSYGRRVLIIDADLRRPSIHKVCGFGDLPGLSESLKDPQQQKLPVVHLTETLSFLPAGKPDPDPMNGLTSDRMRAILDDAAARFDWVIVDAPPVASVPDASLLAGMVDTSLLVVRCGQTPHSTVGRALDALGRERIFGVVLNGVADSDPSEYDSSSYERRRSPA